MEKDHPGILRFAHIHRAFFFSEDEAALNAAWQTVIFAVPAGHQELPLLHEAAKARQSEMRELVARVKAEAEKAEKEKQLITKDFIREDNVHPFPRNR